MPLKHSSLTRVPLGLQNSLENKLLRPTAEKTFLKRSSVTTALGCKGNSDSSPLKDYLFNDMGCLIAPAIMGL